MSTHGFLNLFYVTWFHTSYSGNKRSNSYKYEWFSQDFCSDFCQLSRNDLIKNVRTKVQNLVLWQWSNFHYSTRKFDTLPADAIYKLSYQANSWTLLSFHGQCCLRDNPYFGGTNGAWRSILLITVPPKRCGQLRLCLLGCLPTLAQYQVYPSHSNRI